MTYVTSQGLQIPTLEDELAALIAEQKGPNGVDPNVDTEADSPVGQINAIVISHLREVWEAVGVAYNSFNPDAVEDFLLDALAALTGTRRADATYSKFILSRRIRLSMNALTTVPAGTVFHVNGDPLTRFVSLTDVTSVGAGDYLVAAQCDQLGPVHCNANTLTVIATPVVGLNAVTNDFDAVLGTLEDNNPQLRTRRERELRATGSSTVDAIAARVAEIELDDQSKPVLNCIVFENTSDITDGSTGNPPHSLEVLIYDGLVPACPDAILVQTIWDNSPGGIQLVGGSSAVAVDSKGINQTVAFSRVAIRDIKFSVDLSIDTKTYAGDSVAKDIIANAFLTKVRTGHVIRFQDYMVALLRDCPGVLQVTNIQLGRVGNAFLTSWTNLALAIREMGSADTTNMVITSSPGVP